MLLLTQADIDFLLAQLTVPGNDPRNRLNGTILDPIGIRDTQGVGNNLQSPLFGAADQLFPRWTKQSWVNAQGTLNAQFERNDPSPTSYGERDKNIYDAAPRVISNLVANQSAEALAAIGYGVNLSGDVLSSLGLAAGGDPGAVTSSGLLVTDFEAPLGGALKIKQGGSLVINGVSINIATGSTVYDIQHTINVYSRQTNVAADFDSNGNLVLTPTVSGHLVVQDDPAATPGGRLSPLTGNMNPLPYSSFMALFGQFFDHGLDFVHKGADGAVMVPLDPRDPLYDDPRAPGMNFLVASRTNTVHVNIGQETTDTLATALGLASSQTTQVNSLTAVTGTAFSAPAAAGVLMLNHHAIDIASGATLDQVVAAINAQKSTTGITASITDPGPKAKLTLTPAAGESVNTVSPFIDLSQSYGSDPSHTAFVREYRVNESATGAAKFEVTGKLVSGDGALGDNGMATWLGIKTNAARVGITLHDRDVEDIPEVRLNSDGTVYFDQYGAWLVARDTVTGGIYYVQNSNLASNTVFIRVNANGTETRLTEQTAAGVSDGDLVLQTVGHAFLDDMAHGVLDKNYLDAAGDLKGADQTYFNQLKLSGVLPNDMVAYADYQAAAQTKKALLEDHFVAGDGRANENIGLTTIHDVFHAEHNRVLLDLKSKLVLHDNNAVAGPINIAGGANLALDLGIAITSNATDSLIGSNVITGTVRNGTLVINGTSIAINNINGNGNTLDEVIAAINAQQARTGVAAVNNGNRLQLTSNYYTDVNGNVWSNEMLFQAAKLVTEMEYQHLVFGEFARKLSPNVNAFASYDILVDPAITAEFAHAVYRFGHSMLTETVSMTGLTNGVANGTDESMKLLDAFLNPRAYGGDTAAMVSLGMANQVGNAIDEWTTDALRNNLVGLPLDLATLNIVRGRDAGVPSLNQTRAQLYAKTGLESLKAYTSWDDFGKHLLHPESLENFIMAYADVGSYGALDLDLRAKAHLAMADATFMNGSNGLNNIDLWIGGLAEAKVTGGMLGSTFDFIFATQMVKLQNADRFYYLNRLVGTDLLVNIEGQLFSDIVSRNTGVKHMYADIFSVADASVELLVDSNLGDTLPGAVQLENYTTRTDHANDGPYFLLHPKLTATDSSTYNRLGALEADTQIVKDVNGQSVLVGKAGWVNTADGWVFYGNPGDYLDARGVLNPNGTGNASENIGGTDNAERINAGGGNDTVHGDGGNDIIEGGTGNDFLYGGDGNDLITDIEGDEFLISGGLGNDTIKAGMGIDAVFGNEGDDIIYGGTGTDVLDAGDGDDVVYGDNGAISMVEVNGVIVQVMDNIGDADIISGGAGKDKLYGGGGVDTISGEAGNDTIYGGMGADALTGLDGDDTFVMDGSDFGFGELIDGGVGIDTVDYSASVGNGIVTAAGRMGVNVNLSAAPAFLVGVPNANAVADAFLSVERLIGSAYNDTLVGGASVQGNLGLQTNELGVPILVNGVVVPMDFYINGGDGADSIIGGDGVDTLDGGTGNDNLTGGLGDDTYYVDSANDVIVELAGEGVDRVFASGASYTLSADIENLTSTGNAAFTGTGNALNNVITSNILLALNDTLNGAGGNDTLIGGLGDDTYIVDRTTDVIQEAAAEGTDTVRSSVTYTLGANLENLTLTGGGGTAAINGTGNDLNNRIIGNNGANVLDGGAGLDTLEGGTGNDTYIINTNDGDVVIEAGGTDTIQTTLGTFSLASYADVENLSYTGLSNFNGTGNGLNNRITAGAGADALSGGLGNDTLIGGAGNDTLFGGAGVDVLMGGDGSDVFLFTALTDSGTAANSRDTITDFAQLQDKIDLSSIFNNFSFIGTGAFDALGQLRFTTGAVTVIEGEVTGDNVADFRIELNGRFTLTANDFVGIGGRGAPSGTPTTVSFVGTGNNADRILGGAGNDVLMGMGGNDSLSGGAGNDLIDGGAGNDTIIGGLGADLLQGGAGSDRFVFNSALGAGNVDTILDYNSANDTIVLENTGIFSRLATGTTLNAANFYARNFTGLNINTAAQNANQWILYDTSTGNLYYDADGRGAGAAQLFATLASPTGTINANEFTVI